MFVSVIVATRNRSYAIKACLDAIGAALRKLDHAQGEIIVVDNGSSDDTRGSCRGMARHDRYPAAAPVRTPRPGLSRAQKIWRRSLTPAVMSSSSPTTTAVWTLATSLRWRTLRPWRPARSLAAAWNSGTSGICRSQSLRHPSEEYWLRQDPRSSHRRIAGSMIGCNLAIPKSAFLDLGGFDEEFGSGAYINSGGDTDFLYRAYLAGYTLRYDPALVVHHHHGRRSPSEARKLVRDYAAANGALAARYGLRRPALLVDLGRRARDAVMELIVRDNRGWPEMGISARTILGFSLQGVWRYTMMPLKRGRPG